MTQARTLQHVGGQKKKRFPKDSRKPLALLRLIQKPDVFRDGSCQQQKKQGSLKIVSQAASLALTGSNPACLPRDREKMGAAARRNGSLMRTHRNSVRRTTPAHATQNTEASSILRNTALKSVCSTIKQVACQHGFSCTWHVSCFWLHLTSACMYASMYICIYKSYKKKLQRKSLRPVAAATLRPRSCLWWLAGTAERLCYRLAVSGRCLVYGSCPHRSVHFFF